MRYVLLKETETVGVLQEGVGVLDLTAVFADAAPKTCLEAACHPTLARQIASLPARIWEQAIANPALLAPIPQPNRILAIGRNYAEHARELGNIVPEEPVVFLKASTSVIGPEDAIQIPDWVGRVDFEAELLVVLGQGGKDIAEADALSHVCGYTLFNDVTAREKSKALQSKGHPWFLAKSMDTFGPLGPYLLTIEEVADPHNLEITLTVNGVIKQHSNTDAMIHSIPKLIAFLSRWLTLEKGDVIATGTPSGVAPIVPGDRVEVTIPGFGTLANPVTLYKYEK
jgi:5-oxopent-3-ene-1,2,5-tricarboxylate decarboxylase / 2-hydroxyhepta-2,4-diene-1,7-dioate isomerase